MMLILNERFKLSIEGTRDEVQRIPLKRSTWETYSGSILGMSMGQGGGGIGSMVTWAWSIWHFFDPYATHPLVTCLGVVMRNHLYNWCGSVQFELKTYRINKHFLLPPKMLELPIINFIYNTKPSGIDISFSLICSDFNFERTMSSVHTILFLLWI